MELDRDSPVPLYHQIAERLRYRIATGAVRAGERLPAVRAAAVQWGVNLHTVRRAYRELEREGLVSAHAGGGTRVRQDLGALDAVQLPGFARQVADTARARYGAGIEDLVQALRGVRAGRSVIVYECSRSLADSLADQIASAHGIEVRARRIGGVDDEAEDALRISTLFHRHELLASHPTSDWHFVAIRPDPSLYDGLKRNRSGRRMRELVVLETDASLAHNIALDLRAGLWADVEIRIVVAGETLDAVIRRAGDEVPVLVSPQNWDRLTEAQRARPGVIELRYVVDERDLVQLGDVLRMPAASPRGAGPGIGESG